MIAGFGSSYCDLSLVNQVAQIVQDFQDQEVVLAGHSLGGTAAFCLASRFNNVRSVSLNPGAAPTNPVIDGPGQRATVYHIVGDIISSHMSDKAANVIRIKKKDSVFGKVTPHDSTNILANSGDWKYSTAEEEDELYQQFTERSYVKYFLRPAQKFYNFLSFVKQEEQVKDSPIPGSKRWYAEHPNESSPVQVSPQVQEINDTAQKNLEERKLRDKYKQLYLTGGGSSKQFA